MKLQSFHSDVRQLLLTMRRSEFLTTYPRFVGLPALQATKWLEGKVPSDLLHYNLNDALAECTAGKGDVIIVVPGHYEDLGDTSNSGAIDVDVADVTIIGLGRGSSMPRIDFNHADADFIIGAANVSIENIHFEATVTGVKIGIAIEAAGDYFTIKDCKFTVETTTTDEFLYAIDIAAGANYGNIVGNFIDQGLGGATGGIHLNGTSVGHKIHKNRIIGDFGTANIVGSTAASTVLDIGYNILVNGEGSNIGAQPCIELNGNSTGEIYNNYCVCNLATVAAAIVATLCMLFENYYNEDVSGAGTGGLIGTASAND